MANVAVRHMMAPSVFFVAGLSLLAASYLPGLQQRRLPMYPPSPLPYSAAPLASAPPVASALPIPQASIGVAVPLPAAPAARPTAGPAHVTDKIKRPKKDIIIATPNGKIKLENLEKKVTIGRADPFKSLMALPKRSTLLPPPPPIPFPGLGPVVMPPPEMLSAPLAVAPALPRPSVAPLPAPALKAGLSLQGMVSDEPSDVVAILNVDGNTQLVRAGDVIRRTGFVVTILSIDQRSLSVTLTDNKGHTAVLKTE